MEQSLANAFVHLGMSEDQEHHLGDMIHGFMKELMDLFDRGKETYEALQDLGQRLGQFTSISGDILGQQVRHRKFRRRLSPPSRLPQ
jgi:hypothetical protein